MMDLWGDFCAGLPVLALVVLAVTCSANGAGHAFVAPRGFARSGISVAPGSTAVVGLPRWGVPALAGGRGSPPA